MSISVDDFTDEELRYDTSSSAKLRLPDGRDLGYAEYGAPDGQPAFYLHGFPGCRVEGAGLHSYAAKVGLRVIAIDRPGYGWSSPHPTRTVLDHADDVDALANHLKLDHFGVLGISGGGPYALACAKALPREKLRAVSIVCGLGPPDIGYWGMAWPNYCGWTFLQRWAPWMARVYFSWEPAAQLQLSDRERLKRVLDDFEKNKKKLHPKDVPYIGSKEVIQLMLMGAEVKYAQGMDGMLLDYKLLNSDWGFQVEDIRKDLPVQMWYGALDENVPLNHGIQVAARLGRNSDLRVKDETHGSIWFHWREEFLGNLARAIRE